MKLLTAKKRKIAILFTGGLGDTLLFIPLLKELRKKQFIITCIFYSPDNSDCLLDESLYSNKVHIQKKAALLAFALLHFKQFRNFYINHLSHGKAILLAARICSYAITQTRDQSESRSRMQRNCMVIPTLSDAEQNLRMLYSVANAGIKNISSFYLEHPKIDRARISKYLDKERSEYIIVQVSSGNNNTPFKNWPIDNWIRLLTKLAETNPHIAFLITGDSFEAAYGEEFKKLNYPNCHVLIGETSIAEIFNLVAFSNGYIGLDSGIMHMAVVLKKRTVTIFGASNEKLYGYHLLDKDNHQVIINPITCRPCSSWKNANRSRVSSPLQCPDLACLTGIAVDDVYKTMIAHFNWSTT